MQVWLTLAVAAVGFGGMFAVYSYITPTLTQVSGFNLAQVPAVLMLWGAGMVCGNGGGWLADRALTAAILPCCCGMLCLALFAQVAHIRWAAVLALFLLGNGFALVPALQSRLMKVASNAQTLAASLNHSAFNISNAIGASLGGAAISAGYGWAATGWVGASLATGGMALMFCLSGMQRGFLMTDNLFTPGNVAVITGAANGIGAARGGWRKRVYG